MTEAVKFKYGASEMTFQKEEILELRCRRIQPNVIHKLMSGKPVCYFTGKAYRIIEIDFDLYKPDTISRINTLRSYDGTLTCYYRYGFDGNYNNAVTVQMLKNGIAEPFRSGKRASAIVTATFVESSTGRAVPIPRHKQLEA